MSRVNIRWTGFRTARFVMFAGVSAVVVVVVLNKHTRGVFLEYEVVELSDLYYWFICWRMCDCIPFAEASVSEQYPHMCLQRPPLTCLFKDPTLQKLLPQPLQLRVWSVLTLPSGAAAHVRFSHVF